MISSAKWKITRKSMRAKIKEGEFKHGKEINEWKKNDLSSDNNSDRGTVFQTAESEVLICLHLNLQL